MRMARNVSPVRLSQLCTALPMALMLSGCVTIETGHRAMLFDPFHGGLRHEVLTPGTYRLPAMGHADDFDITYSTRKEEIVTASKEGWALGVKVAVIYRPIESELFKLDSEIGLNYYEEVIGPEFRSATGGVFAHHAYSELHANNKAIEDEVEAELRNRLTGRHIEISSVTMEAIALSPEIANSLRDRIVREENAKSDRYVAEQEAARVKMKNDAMLREKQIERQISEEQAKIDKEKAETSATVQLTKARADAEEAKLLASAHAEENRAERHTLTPLTVMDHAYEALGKLGGTGTLIMLGDWSKVPNFLLPNIPAFKNALAGIPSGERAAGLAADDGLDHAGSAKKSAAREPGSPTGPAAASNPLHMRAGRRPPRTP